MIAIVNWQATAERVIRLLTNETRPIYLLDVAEIGVSPQTVAGWTSGVLDLCCRVAIGDRWQGRGFCAVIDPAKFETWQEIVGACLHEFAHYLDHGLTELPVKRRDPELLQIAAIMSAKIQFEFPKQDPDDPDDLPPPWDMHEARFVRACCHLAHRAGALVESIRPQHLQFGIRYYGHPFGENVWMTAIDSELSHTGDLRTLLDTDPPAKFAETYRLATSC
jgi:hypothetical protein